MISMSELVSRRLRPAMGAIERATNDDNESTNQSSYNAARLGLDAIDEDVAQPTPPPMMLPSLPANRPEAPPLKLDAEERTETATHVVDEVAEDAPAFRRTTVKLPTELHSALRDLAGATGRYQYQLVAEALEEYLDVDGSANHT